eukprot:6172247-Pleurochrysis_carterae.AAC.1
MPLWRRLGRIGGAYAGEPRGGVHRRRRREHMKEATGGRRPDACDRVGVAARVDDGESRRIVG